ncbi:MAG: hypothetical protein J0H37_03135, partial [Hyphomicrobium denitrificans]|nr:hypothetical protein [Hyphomicrobium denitrificans]
HPAISVEATIIATKSMMRAPSFHAMVLQLVMSASNGLKPVFLTLIIVGARSPCDCPFSLFRRRFDSL